MSEQLSETLAWLAGEQDKDVQRLLAEGDPSNLARYHQGMRNAYRVAAKIARQAEQRRDQEAGG